MDYKYYSELKELIYFILYVHRVTWHIIIYRYRKAEERFRQKRLKKLKIYISGYSKHDNELGELIYCNRYYNSYYI